MPPLLAVGGGLALAGGGTAAAAGGATISAGTAAWILGGATVATGAYIYRDEIADGVSNAMSGAQTEATTQDQAVPATRTVTCARCAQNPCAYLACGIPGSTYRGGAHGCMTGTTETVGDGLDSHHMPANSQSPLPTPVGPAIQMDPVDHRLTASYGGGVHGPRYAVQRGLLARGQTYAAFMLDAADARAVATAQGNPTKYDGAIAQATAYASCLKRFGIIQ
ncbi:hypothetical protein G6N74_22995 [Mesorhizobium sp. CGMCC 1.15528]|uniref:Uncharacterized protein n=1 Tax=Mesorhizobium zhangyense TaxID=1776730 RepID=A0A7C9RAC8_9HYPH|nr:hypothetical protein [Mesorhizobium zhangyense]NGN43937.1 hypothetical protein [Mesorhizobium zhangyense]